MSLRREVAEFSSRISRCEPITLAASWQNRLRQRCIFRSFSSARGNVASCTKEKNYCWLLHIICGQVMHLHWLRSMTHKSFGLRARGERKRKQKNKNLRNEAVGILAETPTARCRLQLYGCPKHLAASGKRQFRQARNHYVAFMMP